MVRVTATEFQKNVGQYSDIAMREPVTITSHGRDRMILISVEDYQSLRSQKPDFDQILQEETERHKATIVKLSDR